MIRYHYITNKSPNVVLNYTPMLVQYGVKNQGMTLLVKI